MCFPRMCTSAMPRQGILFEELSLALFAGELWWKSGSSEPRRGIFDYLYSGFSPGGPWAASSSEPERPSAQPRDARRASFWTLASYRPSYRQRERTPWLPVVARRAWRKVYGLEGAQVKKGQSREVSSCVGGTHNINIGALTHWKRAASGVAAPLKRQKVKKRS